MLNEPLSSAEDRAGGRDIVRPAGGRGHDRAASGARHGGGLQPRQQDYRTASGAVIADGTPQAIKNDAEVQRAYLDGFA